jgi:signal transduction histidine kinase
MGRIVLVAGLAAVALGVAAESAAFRWDEPGRWIPDLTVGLAFVAFGLLALARRRAPEAGLLLAATGVAWFLGNFWSDLLYLHRGPLVHLVIAYPGWRPRSPLDAAAVVAGYAAAVVTPVWQSEGATIALAIALVAVAAVGQVRAEGAARRERLTGLVAAGALALVLAGGAVARLAVADGDAVEPALHAYEAVLVAVAAWLYVRLRRDPAPAVADLVIELGETRSGTLRDRLAGVLGDPSLALGYWSPDARAYLDEAGEPLALPAPGSGRSATEVERESEPFAVLVHDAATLRDPALVEAVASATRLSASNIELQAEVRARAGELFASRRRLLVAADDERRRLEERLRGGAERRLVALRESLVGDGTGAEQPARSSIDPPARAGDDELASSGSGHLERARAELAHTLDQLHELARGLHPRELAEAGLPGALAALADRAALPVEVDVRAGRLSPEVEAAVYFVCAEGLANVAKYASAARVELTVEASDGHVSVLVADDGAGGADMARGTGLQGLADRVEALGGRLVVASPRGRGTRLAAEIPLGGEAL